MKLIIVHGWAYSIEPWTQTVRELEGAGIEVRQLRVPGLTAPSDQVWTIDAYAQWLRDELAGEHEVVLLGHSNGGRIAMHMLETHSDVSVRHLILLSSAGIETNSPSLSRKRRMFQHLSRLFAPLKHVPIAKKIVYRVLGSDYGSAPKNMQQTLANMLASDKDFDPSHITTPTSILWGENDSVTPPAMARKLHSLIKSSTLTLFPGWTHAPYKSHPHELATAIQDVWRTLR